MTLAVKLLKLGFQSIESLPEGSNEVRRYFDPHLQCERVGKRIDLTMVNAEALPEASTLQSISHPNIVPVVAAADVAGFDPSMKVIEIVTPFYPQGSITDALLRGERFTGSRAIVILKSALLGLRELHVKHGICHRDVKSGNILLTDAPVHALIADIGVAGKLDQQNSVPTVGNSTIYSPPEFYKGRLSPSADLYSMGLILRELLGGAFPYESYTRKEVLDSLNVGKNPLRDADRALPVWTPKNVRKIYLKATHAVSAKRYQTAKEMSTALDRVQLADWEEVSNVVWQATHPSGSKPRIQVEMHRQGQSLSLSIKRSSGNGWRRIPNFPDTPISSLDSPAAENVFSLANVQTFS